MGLTADPTWLKYWHIFWWDTLKVQFLTNPGIQLVILQTIFLGFIVYYIRKIYQRMDK